MTSETQELENFINQIQQNTIEHKGIVRLMEIGRQQGFGNITNRKKIWPVLLQVNIDQLQKSTDFLDWRKDSETHSQDYDQLKKDAMRSFFSLKIYQDIDQNYLRKKQQDLLQLLDAFAKNQPRYRYFQGFHDVVGVFIGIFGKNVGYHISHRVATTYLRDTFLYTFQQTVTILDRLIYFITVKADQQFEQIFEQFQDQKLGFTMPWIITWFAHSIDDINIITRIWDYLISSQAFAIVYVSAALILETKEQLLTFCNNSYDVIFSITKLGTIHSFYQKTRELNLDIEKVISTAIKLQKKIPFSSIRDSSSLPTETVMKQENFVQLIRPHEIYKNTQAQKQKSKKRIQSLLLFGLLLGILFWSYNIFGRDLFMGKWFDGGL